MVQFESKTIIYVGVPSSGRNYVLSQIGISYLVSGYNLISNSLMHFSTSSLLHITSN